MYVQVLDLPRPLIFPLSLLFSDRITIMLCQGNVLFEVSIRRKGSITLSGPPLPTYGNTTDD